MEQMDLEKNIEDFERKLPLKICFLKNEIQLVINLVKCANDRNKSVFGSIESYIVIDSDGNEGLRFKDTSNPEYVDFTDIFLIPVPIRSSELTIIHGNYVIFEEDEFLSICTKVLKLIFKAYESLRKSVLERELFNDSQYISQVIEVFEMKIHNAMRYKLDEFAEMTEICKKAKIVTGENIFVTYDDKENVMRISESNNNELYYRIYLNPLCIKQKDFLIYDFNWSVPNTDIMLISLKGLITFYERAKVELLKINNNSINI